MEIRKSPISTQLVIALGLIAVGLLLRLVPHLPNFAPIGAIALFGGAVLGWRMAVWLPLAIMILSDSVLGFYPGIEFTWAGFLLVALYGRVFRDRGFYTRISVGALGGSVIFFIVSNLGVWLSSGMYSHTLEGLVQCYYAALPFFRASLAGDIFYGIVIFGIYAFVTRRVAKEVPISRRVA